MGERRTLRFLPRGLVRASRGSPPSPRQEPRGGPLRRQTAFLDEGIASDPELVGGKAVSLARMRSLGLRVPPAFVVTAEACRAYFRNGRLDTALRSEIERAISRLEEETERRFGGAKRPLLVSVRSGAAVSMPGMMDTVLDLGMNPRVEA